MQVIEIGSWAKPIETALVKLGFAFVDSSCLPPLLGQVPHLVAGSFLDDELKTDLPLGGLSSGFIIVKSLSRYMQSVLDVRERQGSYGTL